MTYFYAAFRAVPYEGDDFRSHLDERIIVLEHEFAQIKAKMMS